MTRIVTPNGRGLGWRPSLPRHGRMMFSSHIVGADLPARADLEPECPPVYDQESLGSCTGNALAFLMQFDRMKQGLPDAHRVPSRLMIYFMEREIEGTIDADAGAEGYDGIEALNKFGVCFEDGPDGWPYDIAKFAQRPPQRCYDAALMDRALQSYTIIQDAQQLRGCLAAGFPFAFGFTCYPGLDSDAVARGAPLPMPGPADRVLGGHEVVAVGYDDATRMFKIRNSWGTRWGQAGYFQMPYEYLTRSDLSSDFQTIRLVTP